MQCKKYKNICCILTGLTDDEPNDYCCYDCVIDWAIEHDKRLDELEESDKIKEINFKDISL